MTPKTSVAELNIGDYVADMHYGIGQVEERFTVVAFIRWSEPPAPADSRTGYPTFSFGDYVQQFMARGGYGNKMLHVIGFNMAGDFQSDVVCAYCYDGRISGIVVLRDKR